MPAIRDEEWTFAPSIQEGVEMVDEGEHNCIRFSGLMVGEDAADKENLAGVFKALEHKTPKSICLDWLNIDSEAMKGIESFAASSRVQQEDIDSFHLTMINLGVMESMNPVCHLLKNNLKIMDLILTFCSINDETVKPLSDAIAANNTILSLNMNFNLLRKDGYLTLAKGLVTNQTLRYLEVKKNKATKDDLKVFVQMLDGNTHLELIDVGQNDDIDGKIEPNNIPEPDSVLKIAKKKKSKKSIKAPENPAVVDITEGNDEAADEAAPEPENGEAAANDINIIERSKEIMDRNKTERKGREKQLKLTHLTEALDVHASSLSTCLKHCKILMLGEKGCGKTFFAHCLVHQLYASNDNDTSAQEVERKLNTLSFARTTELGWTRINKFRHVNLALAKYISARPENIENRRKANEVCFQFAEDVTISASDLKYSILQREDEELLQTLHLGPEEESKVSRKEVFNQADREGIVEEFNNNMDDLIERALRENNYPSFSLWDLDTPPGFDETFRLFFNNHGLIFVFFNLMKAKEDLDAEIKAIKKYLKPVDLARRSKRDFTSKILLVGTFLDEVVNVGEDEKLLEWVALHDKLKSQNYIKKGPGRGHLDFLLSKLDGPDDGAARDAFDLVDKVRKMILAMNYQFEEAFSSYEDIAADEDSGTMFFPLSNNLPKSCSKLKEDFDDISGINKFRRKVRKLIDNGNIEILKTMKSLRDCRIIDRLMERRAKVPTSPQDMTSKYLTYEELTTIAEESGITSRAELAVLLRYLDVTGIVFWRTGTESLQDMIVLDPDYIIDGLKEFYESMGPDGAAYIQTQLEAEQQADQVTGLTDDLNNLLNLRLVSGDLLLQKLCSRDKNEYFRAILENCFHINKLNTQLLNNNFSKHSFKNVTNDEVYLVPSFAPVESGLREQMFSSFQVKFVPVHGLYLTGTFERAFVRLVDTLDVLGLAAGVNKENNTLEFKNRFTKVCVGDSTMTMMECCGSEDDNEGQGYLMLQFSSETAVDLMFKFITTVMRKLDGEVHSGCQLEGYVFNAGNWISLETARKKKLRPYFSNKNVASHSATLLANFDSL